MFVEHIQKLKSRLQQPLPGEEVQFLMAPVSRKRMRQRSLEQINPRLSAVLILLFPANNHLHTVLIQRQEYAGIHSAQVAFPGGKMDKDDVNLQQTALRETFEEIGIKPSSVEIIGKLSNVYITPSNFLVTPFIGFVDHNPDFIINTYEVKKVITIDLIGLNDHKIKMEKIISHSDGHELKTPYFEIEGLTVWGATAMIISELNAVIDEAELNTF